MDMTVSMEVGSVIASIVGAWVGLWKIGKDIRKERDEEAARVLQAAKESDARVMGELNGKISLLEADFENFKHEVEKDFLHIKETYSNEIKNLGDKIEILRDELRQQHTNLLALLTKLTNNQ